MNSKKHHSIYFKLFMEVKRQIENIENLRPKGSLGIMSGDGTLAVQWRAIRMRYEILLAYLEGRKPDWAYAFWLPLKEVDRRNLCQYQDEVKLNIKCKKCKTELPEQYPNESLCDDCFFTNTSLEPT